MASRPVCFGNFNFDEEKCDTCSEFNIDCILKSLKQELCFSNAIQGNSNLCHSSACPENIKKKCSSARYILNKIKEKTCFSTPEIKAECLECNFFDDCEAAELMKQNLNLTIDKSKDLLKSQVSEMLKEEGQCFGDFSFEKACWDECQWSMRCLKMSGIIAGKKCKYYNNEKVFFTSSQCINCNFNDFCQKIYDDELNIERKALESTKIFRNFYSVSEMREFMEAPNEKR